MTDLLPRPTRTARSRPAPPAPPPSVTVVGVVAAVRSAGLGILAVMVVVLVAWATAADSGADASQAVATALMAWLLAHHAHLAVPGGELALPPLGLTALPLVLLHTATFKAGRAAKVKGRSGVLSLVVAVTATYAVLATLVALLARTSDVRTLPLTAFVGAAVVALVGAGTGAVRATGTWSGVTRRLPSLVRDAVAPAAAALGVLVATGALIAGAALAVHHDRAVALLRGLDTGDGGGLLLGLLCLAYVPTAAMWGLAYLVGPGFAVGSGTSVSVVGAHLGAVPAFPLLAALPSGTGSGLASALLAVPLLAGVLAGLLAVRAGHPDAGGWRALAELAGTIGGLVAAAVAVLCGFASGPAGPGRFAEVGPQWWLVGPAAGLEVAVAAAVTLLVLRRR
jgi:hypothetical protein